MLLVAIIIGGLIGYASIVGLVHCYVHSRVGHYAYWDDRPYGALALFWPLTAIWFFLLRFPISTSTRFGRYIAVKSMQRQKDALETRMRVANDINKLRVETEQLEAEAEREVEECLR